MDHNVRRKVTSLFQSRSWCLLCILIIVSLSLVDPSGAKHEFYSMGNTFFYFFTHDSVTKLSFGDPFSIELSVSRR